MDTPWAHCVKEIDINFKRSFSVLTLIIGRTFISEMNSLLGFTQILFMRRSCMTNGRTRMQPENLILNVVLNFTFRIKQYFGDPAGLKYGEEPDRRPYVKQELSVGRSKRLSLGSHVARCRQ